jgi:hypothetical protein
MGNRGLRMVWERDPPSQAMEGRCVNGADWSGLTSAATGKISPSHSACVDPLTNVVAGAAKAALKTRAVQTLCDAGNVGQG